jgi:plastocyanin
VPDQTPTPGRARARSGVLAFALAALALPGCEAAGGGATIQLDTAEVRLERGSRVHDVRVRGAADTDTLAPAAVRADPGDAVRFTTDDHRTHAMGFDAARLAPPVREYLERTGQLRGPPLLNRGAAWVVVLDDAPAGRYPFLCRLHGAHGVLQVQAMGGD